MLDLATRQDQFSKRLRASKPAVFAVALHLHIQGKALFIPPTALAPSLLEADDFVDDGDLFVVKKQKHFRVEVKGIKHNFTCADDFPFKDCFVQKTTAVDRAQGSVFAWFIVSNTLTHAGIIRWNTHERWRTVDYFATNYQQMERVYSCPLDAVEFLELER